MVLETALTYARVFGRYDNIIMADNQQTTIQQSVGE